MRAIPAVDLKGGRCVQLVGGRPEDERVSLPDPIEVARRWRDLGFASLHIVDLDGALGTGSNMDLIGRIVASVEVDVQLGGGVRDDETAAAVLETGVARVIVGTRAVDDRDWLAALAERHPKRVVVAADVGEGKVLRKGWAEASGLDLVPFLEDLAALPIAGFLCTDVGREGRVQGIDRVLVAKVLEASERPVWISGGVTTTDELRFLAERGAAGAVLGMALYTGVLDAAQVAEEFGA